MSGEDGASTEVRDFKEVLSTPTNGALPVVVGGHAVHLWAMAYQERLGAEIARWLPLTSKDLDLYGNQALLEELKNEFGGDYRLSGPRGPIIGQLVVMLGGIARKIDVLRDVYGLNQKDLAVEPMQLEFEVDGRWFPCRVLPLITMFQAKVANLAHLDQTNRNDGKHVAILQAVVREYLTDLLDAVEAGELEPRGAITPLEQTLRVVSSRDAATCSAKFGTDFSGVWPWERLDKASNERVGKFIEHRLLRSASDRKAD